MSRFEEHKQCPECKSWHMPFVRSCGCGYAFEPEEEEEPMGRWSVVLSLCCVLAGIQFVAALGCSVYAFAKQQWLQALVVAPAAAIYSCGFMIVFWEVNQLIEQRSRQERSAESEE